MMMLVLPDLEFQHRNTWKHQQMKWRASRAAAKAPNNTCRRGRIHLSARPKAHREKALWLTRNLVPEYGAVRPEWPPQRRTGYPAGCTGRRWFPPDFPSDSCTSHTPTWKDLNGFSFTPFCTDGFITDSQEEWEQQWERRERAEADGHAKLACVPGQTGGDGEHAEFHQAGEKCGRMSSDQRSIIHVRRVCMAWAWDQLGCKLVPSGEELVCDISRGSCAIIIIKTS